MNNNMGKQQSSDLLYIRKKPPTTRCISDACHAYYHIVNTFLWRVIITYCQFDEWDERKRATENKKWSRKMTHLECSTFQEKRQHTNKNKRTQTKHIFHSFVVDRVLACWKFFENKTKRKKNPMNRSKFYGTKALILLHNIFAVCI